eukprot:5177445-Ditylum_brightwellii.AAC.1
MGNFIWQSPDVPTNFTAFAFPSTKINKIGMVALAIKAAEGKGLKATDTKNLTKLHLSTAKCVNTTRHMLHNLVAVAAELT